MTAVAILIKVSVLVLLIVTLIEGKAMDISSEKGEARQSQPTEKGRAYSVEMKKNDLKRLFLKLTRDGNVLLGCNNCSLTPDEAESLTEKIRHWKNEHLSCLQVQLDLKTLLSDEDLEKMNRTNE